MLTVSQHPIETLILFFSLYLSSDNTLLFLFETLEVFIVQVNCHATPAKLDFCFVEFGL